MVAICAGRTHTYFQILPAIENGGSRRVKNQRDQMTFGSK